MANTLLLFLLLTAMTGARYQSAFVAGLFALHPLHVESVAWVAERKDLLSTFFGLLTVWSYTRHVKRPGLLSCLRTALLFTLGLMCKPMLVTLPFLLLLIDYWPLGRVERVTSRPFLHLIWEKWPLFLLSLASCIITFQVQQGWGAIKTLGNYPFDVRIANALIAYVSYMGKMVWPQGLSVLYPHTGQMPPLWQVWGASLFLIFGSVLVVRMARHHAYLPVGWFWYLGTLFPVMGLIQVGFQKMADRYTYLSLIGLFIIIAWGIPELAGKCRYRKWLFILLSLILFLSLMICTWRQIGYWRNSTVLFEQALHVTSNNWVAHHNLGIAHIREGRYKNGIYHYLEALRIKPDSAETHYNLGAALIHMGKAKEAMIYYQKALMMNPNLEKAHNDLGVALIMEGRIKEAVYHFYQALEIRPGYPDAQHNLSAALEELEHQ